ncbi:MAG: hypothetical protein L0Z07_03425 [Planctomycetes bacterium]|nr:hypothetical protein [Planctomycetota bacterium]
MRYDRNNVIIDCRPLEKLRTTRCPAARWLGVVALLGVMLLAGPLVEFASASVLSSGNVIPLDNPFTLNFNEGLPIDGNFVNPFEAPDQQTFFEGIHDESDPLNPTNVNMDIIVGQTSIGQVLISGESALRFNTLVIGDSGVVGGVTRFGTGIVRVTGFGSLFNNDPTILPTNLPANFSSKNPRPLDLGFDLYVGGKGNGTFDLSAGGRAEIQDAVVVGDTGIGTLNVTGYDSFLQSGGFDSGVISGTEIHSVVIGRLGSGFMNITQGGQVYSLAAPPDGDEASVAASIGSEPYTIQNTQPPEAGGQGTVTVDGNGSKWIVGGTMQIGGYHNASEGAGFGADLEGDDTQYAPTVGRGTLNVTNGGFVSILDSTGDTTSVIKELDLAIGRFGRIHLDGGRIEMLSGFESGTNPDPLIDDVRVINDGIISGSGTISTGRFRNRVLGEVRVAAGEQLLFDVAGEFVGTNPEEPLVNYGLLQVLGNETARAELEFDRAPNSINDPVRPFLNQRLPDDLLPVENGGRETGLIHSQWGHLRFRSDLLNQGEMAFTAGDNIVSGNVLNLAAVPADLLDEGVVFVSGPDTSVVFEDDLTNLGKLTIEEGADIDILDQSSFITAGNLIIDVSPIQLSQISVAGNAGIAGKLTVRLKDFAAGSLLAGDTFPIISITGTLGGVDLSNPLDPTVDLTKNPLFTQIDIQPPLSFFAASPDLVMIPVYTTNSVLLSVLSTAAFVGADFDGDGIVDRDDLAIWRTNYGITMGATVLQGDADGDGDVDGDDFLKWQQQVGGPPVPGMGSGAGLTASVPEPASFLLLLFGGLLTLALQRRGRRI